MAEQLTRGDPLSGPPTLDVGVRVTGFRAVTVVAAGEIDTLGAPVVEAALSRVWTQGSRRVTVDLTAVTFLNGAGLRVLARARSTARRRRAALTLRAGDRWVYRLLELVDLRNATVGPPALVESDSGGDCGHQARFSARPVPSPLHEARRTPSAVRRSRAGTFEGEPGAGGCPEGGQRSHCGRTSHLGGVPQLWAAGRDRLGRPASRRVRLHARLPTSRARGGPDGQAVERLAADERSRIGTPDRRVLSWAVSGGNGRRGRRCRRRSGRRRSG